MKKTNKINQMNHKLSIRWFYMIVGVIAMLFAGVLYAWSFLKAALSKEFGLGSV